MTELLDSEPGNHIYPLGQRFERNSLSRSRLKAVLVGGAIGDTLGMPVEGWRREQIRRYLGYIREPIDPVVVKDHSGRVIDQDENGHIPYISPYLHKGQVTDDTWLAVATARSIVQSKGLNLDILAQNSVTLFEEQLARMHKITPEKTPLLSSTYLEGKIPQPFGGTTFAAFENLQKGIPPTKSGVMSLNPGNGPTIKVAPIGMYMLVTGHYDEGLQFAQDVGEMTHLDPRSVVSGVVQSHAVYSLLNGLGHDEFISSVIDVCKKWEKSTQLGKKVTLLQRLQWVDDNKDTDEERAYQYLGPGWPVTKNYPFTLFMFHKYWDNPLEGLLKTLNYGGDCDSTAAIFGALAGAKNDDFYPKNWVRMLEAQSELMELADKIFALRK